MSFYVVGNNRVQEVQDEIRKVFNEFEYIEEANKFEYNTADTFVYCQLLKKPIEDIFIRLEDTGSWVLLVGAPVINVKTDSEKYIFARELLNNPTKVLRHEIDGHFAVLAFDASTKEIIAGSDWNSLIPVYFGVSQDGVLLSNAEIPLAKLLNSDTDAVGFAQSIHYGAVWGGRTRFVGIHKLEPCEFIKIDHLNNIIKEKYWEPQMEVLWKGSFDTISQRWLQVMEGSIRTFTDQRDGHAISADLTGGEDSRMVVALLYKFRESFKVRVAGSEEDTDVRIAKEAAKAIGLDLVVEESHAATKKELSTFLSHIISHTDGYGSFFTNASSFVHEMHYRPMEYTKIHLCGLPGGGQFRGANYLRAKLLFPAIAKTVDCKAYTKRKFLLDYTSNLLSMSDKEYFECVYKVMEDALEAVKDFPAGIQIDHLMRVRYGCLLTANIKRPFYFAFAPRDMTRSTYNVSPAMKRGGRQYKAIIEKISPKLAWVKSQAGVPTVRKTLLRSPLFFPEFYSMVKKSFKGIARQMFKGVPAFRTKGHVNERHHLLAFHEQSIRWLFDTKPYSAWFKSAESMLSGNQYNPDELNKLLSRARLPDFDQVQLFGRVVNQELTLRKVRNQI